MRLEDRVPFDRAGFGTVMRNFVGNLGASWVPTPPPARLMVSVWDAETRLSLATRHAPGSNEVAATLAALKGLVLKGCIVTGDALHCYPAMAAEVRARGAHYALKLKANNAPLFNCALAELQAAASITCRARG